MTIPSNANYKTTSGLATNLIVTGYLLGAMAYNNGGGGTLYLMVFEGSALPSNGTAPSLPPVQILANQTEEIPFLPPVGNKNPSTANNWVIALSSTDSTLTIAAGNYGIITGFTC